MTTPLDHGSSRRRFFVNSGLALTAGALSPLPSLFAGEPKSKLDTARIKEGATSAVEFMTTFKESYDKVTHPSDLATLAEDIGKSGKVFAKLGMLGGAFGAGLSVLDMFGAFGDSAEAKTDKALAEISGKLDRMSEKLDKLQDKLVEEVTKLGDKVVAKIEQESAKVQMNGYFVTLTTTQNAVNNYRKLLITPDRTPQQWNDLDTAESSLTMSTSQDPSAILEAATGIAMNVLGTSPTSTCYMDSMFESTMGDMRQVNALSALMLNMIISAHTNWVMINVMRKRRGDENNAQFNALIAQEKCKRSLLNQYDIDSNNNQAASFFGDLHEQVKKKLKSYARKICLERARLSKRFLEDYLGNTGSPVTNDGTWTPNSDKPFKPASQFVQSTGEVGIRRPLGDNGFGWKYKDLPVLLKQRYMCDWLIAVCIDGFDPNRTFGYAGSNAIVFAQRDPDFDTAGLVRVFAKWTEVTPEEPGTGPRFGRTVDVIERRIVERDEVPTFSEGWYDVIDKSNYPNGWGLRACQVLLGKSRKVGDEMGMFFAVSRRCPGNDFYDLKWCNPLTSQLNYRNTEVVGGTYDWGLHPALEPPRGSGDPAIAAAARKQMVDDGKTLEGDRLYIATTSPMRLVYKGGYRRYTLSYR